MIYIKKSVFLIPKKLLLTTGFILAFLVVV